MRVTKRDVEIVKFILDMKFATITDIHTKFFKYRNDGNVSKSEWWARERLRELVLHGLLQSVRFRFDNKCYYMGTENGYYFARSSLDINKYVAKPIKKIDIRTFDHDSIVLKARLLLEAHEKVTDWQSDRNLKENYMDYFSKGHRRDFCPDGVYKSVSGRLIAFEYELAQKSKARYDNKVSEYLRNIQKDSSILDPKYGHVHFVCAKDSVVRYLKDATQLFRSYFTVESQKEFEMRYQVQELLKAPVVETPKFLQ